MLPLAKFSEALGAFHFVPALNMSRIEDMKEFLERVNGRFRVQRKWKLFAEEKGAGDAEWGKSFKNYGRFS